MNNDLTVVDLDREEEADSLGALENGCSPQRTSGRSQRSAASRSADCSEENLSNLRRKSRHEAISKHSMITPVSVQKELLQYKKSEIFGIDFCDGVRWIWSNRYVKVFLIWSTWMTCGTAFYAIRNELGWKMGFYMMVNVGYSVGWGYPVETDHKGLWFSIMNVFVGAIALSYCLSVFAMSVLSDSRTWYTVALYERKMQDTTISKWEKLKASARVHKEKIIGISVCILWVCVGVFWTTNAVKDWIFVQGLYFALSSLTTGGMYPIPSDAPEDYFVIVGVYTAVGVPLMGLAMSDLARMLLNFGSSEVAKEQIRAKVTEEELTMLQVFGMNDSTGMFTRTEFVILSLMQLRVLTPTSVEEINKRFDTLDIGQTGFLATNDIIHKASSRRLSNMFKNSSISDQNRKISGMNGRVIDKNLGS